jgi:hypothetical protein
MSSARTQPYDLVKELAIALAVVASLAVVLTILLSSPDEKPVTIASWARSDPQDFLTTIKAELAGTSDTAGYGAPYNHAADGQHVGPLYLQKWAGVSHPIDTRTAFVPAGVRGDAALLALGRSGALDGSLLTNGGSLYQTDFTKPLLLMADGSVLSDRAAVQHLQGDQWGMMNETGSYPGQSWLWLYTFWYQIEPFKSSANADALVWAVMALLSLAFICIPFIPGVRSIPRWIPLHRLIWREYYRADPGAS